MKKIKLVGCFVLIGCSSSPDIQDRIVNDRVKACSAGFSNEVGVALRASLDKAAIKGDLSGDFKHETKSAIFSEIPSSDRLRAYEDYIACIERHWNGDDK